jgi:hypothetical protein
MNDRRRVHHWTAYLFGEIGSQELDDFGEAIRSPHVPPPSGSGGGTFQHAPDS